MAMRERSGKLSIVSNYIKIKGRFLAPLIFLGSNSSGHRHAHRHGTRKASEIGAF